MMTTMSPQPEQPHASKDSLLRSGSGRTGAIAAVVALLLFAALSLGLHEPPIHRAARVASFWLLSLPVLLVGFEYWRGRARQAAHHPLARWLYAGALVAALLPDRLVRASASELPAHLLRPILYLTAALLLTIDRPRDPRPIWRDLLLVAVLWLPLELKWVQGDFTLLKMLGLDAVIWFFFLERPFDGFGLDWRVRLKSVVLAVASYGAFLAVAIPASILTGFANPGIAKESAIRWVGGAILVYWVVAIPEEALFRGVIQNLLGQALGNETAAISLASVIFGLSHLNNGPHPDWRYIVLATIAGVAYGFVYLRTRQITSSAITHALVDFTWHGFFAGPRT